MAPKSADRSIVVVEQGGTGEAAVDDGMIDSTTKTAVFHSLLTETLWRNG
jgi:hypothetical protein